MSPQVYLPEDHYFAIVDRMVAIAEGYDPVAPFDLRFQFIEALGDFGGVWPDSCLEPAQRADAAPNQPAAVLEIS
jgi:hypothetical protein